MREKRVNLVVLTCSVLVATCASVSYCFVTSNHFDRYVAVFSRAIPIFLSSQIASVNPATTVWVPTDDAENTDGSVHDEFQEVAHVFARPGVRVVKPKEEDEITQQPVPWTSLKDEWKIFQKVQTSERKRPGDKLNKKSGENKQAVVADDEGSSEEDDGDEEEDEEPKAPPPIAAVADEEESSEEDEVAEGRSDVVRQNAPPKNARFPADELPVLVKKKKAQSKQDSLPLAFYGQENHDDDEHDFLKDEAKNFKKKKPGLKKISNRKNLRKPAKDEEEDDVSSSNEQVASVEDYADYALDDDDDAEDEEGNNNQRNKHDSGGGTTFEDIPLAIREMILNDLANQNNGTGYVPNLTPKVTGGSTENDASAENDDNSSEEDDNNAAEVPQGDLGDPDPTPPAIRKTSQPKKGDDDEDEVYADGGGKKGKGKKKKGKKKGGWGWKQKGWGDVHLAPGWGGWGNQHHHKHEDHGWGWDEKHNGVLEQLVKGSTWERVLQYYHWKRDEAIKGDHHHHDHHHHDSHHGPYGHGPFDEHHDHGWGWKGGNGGIKKVVKKAFKGSFWERAVHTYAKYKENQAKNPKKPTLVDLDTDHLHLGR